MSTRHTSSFPALLLFFCVSQAVTPLSSALAQSDSARASTPLILDASVGERRVRRVSPAGAANSAPPFIIKVDRLNGGAPDFVMGTEDVPPGQSVGAHWHLNADEILFIHRGGGIVEVGDQRRAVSEGATVYIPKGARVAFRNTGTTPMSVAFFFSKPGFEDYLRDTSVPEGQSFVPLSDSGRAAIRARHGSHIRFERP